MKRLFFAILCCAAFARVEGQTPATGKEPPPAGPMLKRAPDFARWNVTSKPLPPGHPGAGPSTPGKSREVIYEYTKTGSIYLQQFTDDLGRKWTNWASNKIAATIWPGTGTVILQAHIDGLEVPDYKKADFPGVGWVAESNFVKTTMYNGRKCLVFSLATTVGDPSNASVGPARGGFETQANGPKPIANPPPRTASQVVQSALVDDETRLPVYAQDGKASYTFAYLTPPEAMLHIPADVEKEIKQQAQVVSDFSHPVPRAF